MSVSTSEIITYASANMPESDSTTSGGAIDATCKLLFTDIAATDKVAVYSSAAGDTTQTVTVTGRLSTGVIDSEVISLNGTTKVAGTKNFERILKAVISASHTGTVTLARNDGPTYTTLGTMESGVLSIRRLFYEAAADASGGSTRNYYEKGFIKNTNSTTALTGVTVAEQSDPLGKITFDLEDAINDTNSVANRLSAPTGMLGSFDGSTKTVPGSSLGPADAIGIWFKLTLAAGDSPAKSTYTTRVNGNTT